MKKLLNQTVPMLKYMGMCAVLAIALAACSDDSEQTEVGPEPNPDPTPEYPNEPVVNEKVEMVAQMVAGFVHDAEGNALSGVTVTTGSQRVITDVNGLFCFTEIGAVSGRGVFRFAKDGYFDIVRSFEQTREQFDVVMYPKRDGTITVSETFTATEGKDVEVSGMKVAIPASSLVDESGEAYNGQVQMDMIYMDPNNEHFADMMPGGDLTAIRTDNSSVQLVSYGMVGVNMTGSDGKELQLKEGEQSTVTFPIPEGMGDDAPESIPLWHFNENAGVWVESGEAVRQGNEYVGTVGHFSYWNLDTPGNRMELDIHVADELGKPISGIKVHVGQEVFYTDENGDIVAAVPDNVGGGIWADPEDYPTGEERPGYTEYEPSNDDEDDGPRKKATIILRALPRLMAQIVNDEGPVTILANIKEGARPLTTTFCNKGYFCQYYPLTYKELDPGVFTIEDIFTHEELYATEVQFTGVDIDLGVINISSKAWLGGTFNVRYVDKDLRIRTANINVPPVNSQSGVIIIDNEFYASSIADQTEDTFDMIIGDYSLNRTMYENVLALVWEGALGFDSETLTASVVEEEDEFFRINLSGRGAFVDENSQVYDANAELASAEIVMPLLFQGKRDTQVSSLAKLNLPDFAPQALSVPDMAIMAERGNMCEQGGMLYYKNISYQDYLALTESIKQEGKVDYYFEDNYTEAGYGYGETVFTSGNKVIDVYYESSGLSDVFIDDPSYVMSVMVMDGIKDDIGWFSRSGKSVKKSLPFYHRSDRKSIRK